MNPCIRFLIAFFLACPFISTQAEISKKADFDWKALNLAAIQERGRIKPLDTFTRESLLFVTGRSSWQGISATEVVFSWLFSFEDDWKDQNFVLVDYKPLKEKLGLAVERKYFSPDELTGNAELGKLIREAFQKQQRNEKLTSLEQKANNIQSKLGLLRAVVQGRILTLLPNPAGINEKWFSLAALNSADGEPLPYTNEQIESLSGLLQRMVTAYENNDASGWNGSTDELVRILAEDLGANGAYPSTSMMRLEYHYNHLRPFRWSWIIYTLAFIFLLSFIVTKAKVPMYLGAISLILGFGMNTYGIVLRCILAGRPPVTNMYESVIWVCIGCVAFGGMIWLKYRNAVIPTAALAFAVVGLILGDNLPAILDPSIQPLEPVLRSNFWLTIHVLTITLSYAAFALSLCLGNVAIGNYVFTPEKTERIQMMNLFMYKAVQIGVVLLAAGTILGGVWADYSWGRFWGWDPKEVWALIALLLYLAVLHGRFTGWLRGFGFASAIVISFLGVLMAWYGVNFVLGAGLHSYGFGTGGMSYVGTYVAAQLGFIGVGWLRYSKVKPGQNPSIFPKGGGTR